MKQLKFELPNENLLLFLKLSIFQFLTESEISFYNKDNRVIFENFTNDKTNIQSEFFLTNDLGIFLISIIAIKKDLLENTQLVKISNIINEVSNTFCTYVQDEENYSLFVLKEQISPNVDDIIDGNFWYDKIFSHTNHISSITNLLFVDYPNSTLFKQEEVHPSKLKLFVSYSIKKYERALNIINEQKNRGFEYFTKEELELNIQKELINLQKGKGNTIKLCLLYSIFQNKK